MARQPVATETVHAEKSGDVRTQDIDNGSNYYRGNVYNKDLGDVLFIEINDHGVNDWSNIVYG